MSKRTIYGIGVMGFLCLYAHSARAVVIFDDDFETETNTTDINAPNYWHPRFAGLNVVPGLTDTASVSPTHSMLNNDNLSTPNENNQWFAYVPMQSTKTSYEAWIRHDNVQGAPYTEDIAIWNSNTPGFYAEAVVVRRTGGGSTFMYRSDGANFVDTGVAIELGTWYHIRFDMDPATSTFDLYLGTTPGNVVASGVSYQGSNVGRLFFYSDSVDAQYYIDDVKIENSALAGDLTGDGFVGQDDLNIILGAWGQNVDPPGNPMTGDPSNDGFVGQDDLNLVLGDWGQGTPPAALSAIPEPHAFLLAVMGVTGWLTFRRAERRTR